MKFYALILIGILIANAQCQSDIKGETEAKIIERYGKPNLVRGEGNLKLLYYFAQTKTPDFVVRLMDGIVAQRTWAFSKWALPASGGGIMFAIPRPEEIMAAKGDIKMWIDELEWPGPWKKFDVQGRNGLLDNVIAAASAFGAQNIVLPIDHPFVSLITGGKPENFGTIIQNGDRKTIDILALIKDHRDNLLKMEIQK